jgi:hypothetical protein
MVKLPHQEADTDGDAHLQESGEVVAVREGPVGPGACLDEPDRNTGEGHDARQHGLRHGGQDEGMAEQTEAAAVAHQKQNQGEQHQVGDAAEPQPERRV